MMMICILVKIQTLKLHLLVGLHLDCGIRTEGKGGKGFFSNYNSALIY